MAKHNDASLISIDLLSSKTDLLKRELDEAAQTQSLFATAKLIVLRNVFSNADEKIQAAVLNLWRSAKAGELIILNWERGAPDKRRSLYKKAQQLVKNDQATWQEFIEPKDYSRTNWLTNYLQKNDVRMDEAAKEYLLLNTADLPLWSLASAVDLIALFRESEINLDLVKLYVPQYHLTDNFGVTDLLLVGKKREALSNLSTLSLARQVDIADAISLFGACVWSLRSVLLLKSLQVEGNNDNQLAKESGLNPYVARKIIPNLHRFDYEHLKELLVQAAQLDRQVKNGEQDIIWAVEHLVLNF